MTPDSIETNQTISSHPVAFERLPDNGNGKGKSRGKIEPKTGRGQGGVHVVDEQCRVDASSVLGDVLAAFESQGDKMDGWIDRSIE